MEVSGAQLRSLGLSRSYLVLCGVQWGSGGDQCVRSWSRI